MKHFVGRIFTLALAIAGLGLVVPQAQAQSQFPADKIQVSASDIEVVSPQQDVTLLSAQFRTSTPADLLISVNAECALWTNVSSPMGEADARVTMWVELDGNAVPVTSDPAKGGPDDGRVAFCNRVFRIEGGADVDLFLRTRAANAFTWGTLNVGNGIHTVEVKARLQAEALGAADARAAVGKRTLVVEPEHLQNGATI